MPYKRSYKRKYKRNTRYRKKTGYLGYASSAVTTASKALAVAYGIKRLMNVEFKFHDVQLTETIISDIATITPLTNIAQGDTAQTRDGAQVKITNLLFRYTALVTADAGEGRGQFLRVMLVHDRQTNQALFNIGDLLADTTNFDSLVSPLNLDNKYRFRILYNKLIGLNIGGKATSHMNINKVLDMKIRFDASTPSIADLTSNSLSVVLISNGDANTGPIVTFFSRVRYVDN